ncbi:MAG: deoxyribodipyrimidine photo-lyase, partial [Acidimicrobiales bacterium]
IVWFRRDLRLDDNPAWAAATHAHDRVVPLVVLEPTLLDNAGPFRRAAFVHALHDLDQALAQRGGRLHVAHGDPAAVLLQLLSTP